MCFYLSWKSVCVLLNRARLLITVHPWLFSVSQDKALQNWPNCHSIFLNQKLKEVIQMKIIYLLLIPCLEIIYPLMWYLSVEENTIEQFWFLCGILNLLMALCIKATWNLPKMLFSLAGTFDLSLPNEEQLICRVALVPLTQSLLRENSISLPHLYPEVLSGFLHWVYSCVVHSKSQQSLPMWNDINLFSEH